MGNGHSPWVFPGHLPPNIFLRTFLLATWVGDVSGGCLTSLIWGEYPGGNIPGEDVRGKPSTKICPTHGQTELTPAVSTPISIKKTREVIAHFLSSASKWYSSLFAVVFVMFCGLDMAWSYCPSRNRRCALWSKVVDGWAFGACGNSKDNKENILVC